jgi:iron complex outermembrane recepter protein
LFGTGSGRKIESGLHLGSRLGNIYFRGGMDWLQTGYFPLSSDFKVNTTTQPSYYQRTNSDQQDARYSGRIGWIRKGEDQYVFTYNKQKASFNVPSYVGSNTANNTVQYTDYPYWNRDSYYFNSNTGVKEIGSIKFRAFYDKYPRGLRTFSNLAHTTPTAFTPYDDYSAGGAAEFTTRMFYRNTLSASFFYKDDTHKERTFNYSAASSTPWHLDEDQFVSIGIQDVLNLPRKVKATIGLSIDHLDVAAAYNLSTTNTVIPFACTASTAGGTVAGFCQQANKWIFNPQASVSYPIIKTGTVFVIFAQKNHFPTLKDRYYYASGLTLSPQIPNPTLQPEYARNYTVGYSHAFPDYHTVVQVEAFHSDVRDAIEIANVPVQLGLCTSGSLLCRQYSNVGKERHNGAEFTMRSSLLSRLDVVANYTYLLRRISGDSNMPKVFPVETPRHRAVVTANWRMPKGVMMLANARYESGAYTVDNANKIFPASRVFLADCGMSIAMSRYASLQGGVNNILDRYYYYQEGFPEAGRSFYTNLRFRF